MFEADLDKQFAALGLGHWLPDLHAVLQQRFSPEFHGDFNKWQAALQQLPAVTPSTIDLNRAALRVGQTTDLTAQQRASLE